MEQKLFDVLLENRKVDADSNKYAMAFENIEEGFVVPKEEIEEDNSMEAQANQMLQELYEPILQRFTEGELDYIANELIPNEIKKFRNEKMEDQGYKI
jgi:hypothetical protein